MKSIAFILSILILAFAVIPCIDVPADNCLEKTVLSQRSHNEHHQTDTDLCSPLCTCNCCSTPVLFQYASYDLSCHFFSNYKYSEIISGFLSVAPTSVWQPPELA